MDEYTSEIMLGGHNTLVIHNTCEDSLLATPLILDLVILGELCSRIHIKDSRPDADFVPFHSVLSILSYLCKAPLVPPGTPVVNSLFRQRSAIENILRACIGLAPISHMALEQRVSYDCDESNNIGNSNTVFFANSSICQRTFRNHRKRRSRLMRMEMDILMECIKEIEDIFFFSGSCYLENKFSTDPIRVGSI